VGFIEALKYDIIGLPEASAIHTFLQGAAADLQRSLRWRVQVSNFETACRMIEANVGIGVLPESTAVRHAKSMALSIVQLEDDWAERRLQICVADLASWSICWSRTARAARTNVAAGAYPCTASISLSWCLSSLPLAVFGIAPRRR
jgi:DNA-binding transcriptional LysR family regulator